MAANAPSKRTVAFSAARRALSTSRPRLPATGIRRPRIPARRALVNARQAPQQTAFQHGWEEQLPVAVPVEQHRHRVTVVVLLGAIAVAIYPLAFYTFMRLAGVAVGTVVSMGSAPLASALVEGAIDRRRLTARWMLGAAAGLAGIVVLCIAEAAWPRPGHAAAWPTVLGVGLGLAAGLSYAVYSWAAQENVTLSVGLGPWAATGQVAIAARPPGGTGVTGSRGRCDVVDTLYY